VKSQIRGLDLHNYTQKITVTLTISLATNNLIFLKAFSSDSLQVKTYQNITLFRSNILIYVESALFESR